MKCPPRWLAPSEPIGVASPLRPRAFCLAVSQLRRREGCGRIHLREPAQGLPRGIDSAQALMGRSTCKPAVREVDSEAERSAGAGAGKVAPEPAC